MLKEYLQIILTDAGLDTIQIKSVVSSNDELDMSSKVLSSLSPDNLRDFESFVTQYESPQLYSPEFVQRLKDLHKRFVWGQHINLINARIVASVSQGLDRVLHGLDGFDHDPVTQDGLVHYFALKGYLLDDNYLHLSNEEDSMPDMGHPNCRCAVEPVEKEDLNIESIVAGALYDFTGKLTSAQDVIIVGSGYEVYYVMKALKEFMDDRDLNYKDADVLGWQDKLKE